MIIIPNENRTSNNHLYGLLTLPVHTVQYWAYKLAFIIFYVQFRSSTISIYIYSFLSPTAPTYIYYF